MKLVAAASIVFALTSACGSASPPASAPGSAEGGAGEARVAELEQRVENLERAVTLLTEFSKGLVEQLSIIGEAMAQQGTASAPARRGPQPGIVYSIPVANNPYWGPADAKVTIVEAMEFACPACERTRPFIEQLQKELAGKSVRIVFKSFVVHPTRATIPAQAACAAHMQGKYFELYPLLWDAFLARKYDGADDDMQDVVDAAAQVSGMDMSQFESDLLGVCTSIVLADQEELRRVGTGGTPTFFVNGRVLEDRTVDAVIALVTEELIKADERIAAGASQATYYEDWVVQKGEIAK